MFIVNLYPVEVVTAEYKPFPFCCSIFPQLTAVYRHHKIQLSRSFGQIFRLIYTFYVTLIRPYGPGSSYHSHKVANYIYNYVYRYASNKQNYSVVSGRVVER